MPPYLGLYSVAFCLATLVSLIATESNETTNETTSPSDSSAASSISDAALLTASQTKTYVTYIALSNNSMPADLSTPNAMDQSAAAAAASLKSYDEYW
jgi:hypothetical protein